MAQGGAKPTPDFATPSVVLGTAAVAGSSASTIRSDSTIVAFDVTAPTTQAFGDAAAVGTVAVAAHRDHKHGFPSILASNLPAPPACRVYPSGVQSINSGGSGTAIAYDTEDYDTDTMHDTVTLNTRITVKTAGRYIFGASASWTANATGLRAIWLSRNGSGRLAEYDFAGSATAGSSMVATAPTQMAVNDYIEVLAFQGSGTPLNVSASGNSVDVFWAVRIGS